MPNNYNSPTTMVMMVLMMNVVVEVLRMTIWLNRLVSVNQIFLPILRPHVKTFFVVVFAVVGVPCDAAAAAVNVISFFIVCINADDGSSSKIIMGTAVTNLYPGR